MLVLSDVAAAKGAVARRDLDRPGVVGDALRRTVGDPLPRQAAARLRGATMASRFGPAEAEASP